MTDTFRKHYQTLTEESAKLVVNVKEKAEELEALLIQIKSREMSLAMTNLEQAIMWATKAIVLEDGKTTVKDSCCE